MPEAVNTHFLIFGFKRPGTESESTASVADALFTRPLIGTQKQTSGQKRTAFKKRVCAYCKGLCGHAYSAILIGHIFVKRVNRKEKVTR